ncbi:hypothetical protein FOXYS1_3089 [Fusarium oxysporum]|uniref:2EXR domain-containing protein n=1 Tax=Fusarium oxysporum TaxID=5507 RepID=A0A8H5AIM2_FUSOX|nr:hypothetical protein FOXYS1_3089 [Fusarium oxysporum]
MDDPNQNPQVKPGRLPSLLNPKFPISNATFHLFPNLPTELRQMIWEQSLTCERYIKVEFCTIDKTTGKIRRGGVPGGIPGAIPGITRPLTGPYRILFHHPPKPGALFSTSAESRASAQRFYRIVLPCFYVTESPLITDSLHDSQQNTERNPQGIVLSYVGPQSHRRPQALIPGTLSLNPELDTLEIDGLPLFTNFANDVWNHDPRKAGLYHVAFLYTHWSFSFRVHHLPCYARSEEQLRQVVARLRSVTFIHYADVDKVSYKCPAEHQCLLHYRCLLPVAGATGNFSRQQDPRHIGHEVLNNVYFDLSDTSDLGRPYQKWMGLVEKLRVTTPCVYKIAYTTNRSKSPISCESDTVVHLKSEGERREQKRLNGKGFQQEQVWMHLKETTGQFNGAVETAIGFWTFPIESLGQISRAHNRSEDQRGCFYDLSASWPELCLFDL